LQAQWFPRAIGILDIFHVTERLWIAEYCLYREKSPQAEQFVERYLRLLLKGKVDTVIRSFRKLLSTRRIASEKRKRFLGVRTCRKITSAFVLLDLSGIECVI